VAAAKVLHEREAGDEAFATYRDLINELSPADFH
jgi:hypothetical protein